MINPFLKDYFQIFKISNFKKVYDYLFIQDCFYLLFFRNLINLSNFYANTDFSA